MSQLFVLHRLPQNFLLTAKEQNCFNTIVFRSHFWESFDWKWEDFVSVGCTSSEIAVTSFMLAIDTVIGIIEDVSIRVSFVG